MKKILLFGQDKEQNQVFSEWLKGEKYQIVTTENFEQVFPFLSLKKYDVLIVDIDFPEIMEHILDLCRRLKKDQKFSEIPITVVAYKKNNKLIASAIEAGVDNFILKPFETKSFLNRLDTIFEHIELKSKGKKILDLNFISYLINLTGEANREDFFELFPVIFNRLIIDKVMGIIGKPIIVIMLKRLGDIIGEDYKFVKEVRFENGKIFLDKVDKVSQEVPVEKLVIAFRDYLHGFLQIVLTLTSNILMDRK